MKSLTFTVSKGGIGKSLMTANVGAALANKRKKVVLVEGDPNLPLQKILELNLSSGDLRLEDIIEKDIDVSKAVYPTNFENLLLIPSGVSLQGYFEIDPISFARKLAHLEADFMFIDVPFPLGRAAFLSLGVCEYFIPILTEDEFALCAESAIDTIRLGKYFLKSTPLGFVLNRIKSTGKFNQEFVEDLENLLEIPCIAQIKEDPKVLKSYGEMGSKNAFLAYHKFHESEFARNIDKIAAWLINHEFKTEKKNVPKLLQEIMKPAKF